MSRDFELLQRLEQEWDRPYSAAEPKLHPADRKSGMIKIDPGRVLAVRPAGRVPAAARAEVSKVILRTFLSTPPMSVVTFAGVEGRDSGKWVAACTADILAEISQTNVCLLDADIDNPSMHRWFSVANHGGLEAVLAGASSIDGALMAVTENLWLLPAGSKAGDQPFTSEGMRAVISELLQRCDYLVVSAPDYGSYAKLATIATTTEGVVLVLDAATTRRATAQRAKAMLEAAQVKIIGSVLTNRMNPIPDFIYTRL